MKSEKKKYTEEAITLEGDEYPALGLSLGLFGEPGLGTFGGCGRAEAKEDVLCEYQLVSVDTWIGKRTFR